MHSVSAKESSMCTAKNSSLILQLLLSEINSACTWNQRTQEGVQQTQVQLYLAYRTQGCILVTKLQDGMQDIFVALSIVRMQLTQVLAMHLWA